MKRDWDLIRKQLTDIEAETELFSEVPEQPKWDGQTEAEYQAEFESFRIAQARIFGHYEMLVDNNFIEGLKLVTTTAGLYYCNTDNPRLTWEGHDLLDTIRSKNVWEKIKTTASEKGIELTFDAIKALGTFALKSLLE